jgi:hypothetical protein
MLFGAIVVAGFVAVVANTLYPGARESEKKAELAKNAIAILTPELEFNKTLLGNLRPLPDTAVPLNYFDVSSWEAISKGGLLLGLDSEYVKKILKVYSLVYKANYLLNGLVDRTTGTTSALSNSSQIAQAYRQHLSETFDNLDAAFRELSK